MVMNIIFNICQWTPQNDTHCPFKLSCRRVKLCDHLLLLSYWVYRFFLQCQFGSLLEVNTFFLPVTFLWARHTISTTNKHKLHWGLKHICLFMKSCFGIFEKRKLQKHVFSHFAFWKVTLKDASSVGMKRLRLWMLNSHIWDKSFQFCTNDVRNMTGV